MNSVFIKSDRRTCFIIGAPIRFFPDETFGLKSESHHRGMKSGTHCTSFEIGCRHCLLMENPDLNPNLAIVVWSSAYRCTPPIMGGGNLPLVEPTGVEPVSENLLISLSPGAFCFLEFPLRDANRQASHLGSRFIHDRFNGKPPVRIHHLPDAHTGVVILPGGTGGIKPQHCR